MVYYFSSTLFLGDLILKILSNFFNEADEFIWELPLPTGSQSPNFWDRKLRLKDLCNPSWVLNLFRPLDLSRILLAEFSILLFGITPWLVPRLSSKL